MIVSPQEVLEFWFKECEPSDWFKKSEEFDAEIRTRFLPTYEAIVSGETVHWRKTPRGRLAEIIVLDQFSRNMFREDTKAFAADSLALMLAQEALPYWKELTVDEQGFLVMPFMHSESLLSHFWAAKCFD